MRGDERGAVAVITAITLTVLLLMAAFAIDLGMVRIDTGREQSVSDMAAAAGAATLDVVETVWNAEESCEAALRYARTNIDPSGTLTLTPTSAGATCAATFGSFTTCPAAADDPDWQPPSASYELGNRHTITITLPVPDNHPLMQDVQHGLDWDGLACERVGVSVSADRLTFFAAAGGAGTDGRSARGAVGRAYANDGDEAYASLIVLHPTACQSLVAQNTGTRIAVGSRIIDGEFFPGVITMYPVPPGCSPANKPVINTGGSDSWIRVDGLMLSFGLQSGVPRERIYVEDDVLNNRVAPRPIRGPATTRSDIDHLYNCIDGYPTGATAPRWSPGRSGYVNPYSECTSGGSNHIERLHAAYQTMTATTVPDGWLVFPNSWNDAGLPKACNSASLTPSDPLPPYAGSSPEPPPHYGKRLFINCPGPGVSAFQPEGFALNNWEAVVLNGGITMTGGSSAFASLGDPASGTTVYMQTGIINRNSGPLTFQNTFVYQNDGRLNVAGSAGSITWSPPHEAIADSCATIGNAPNAACFAKLAYWGNATSDNEVGGTGALLFIQGIVFSPNNKFNLGGGGNDVPLDCDGPLPTPAPRVNLRDAQMWASQILVRGSGIITLCPSPEFGAPIEFPGSGLIR